MYFDNEPCAVCGSRVELRARQVADSTDAHGPVGPADGFVGDGDTTPDERFCTNADCPTHTRSGTAAGPTP
jgi:hypothetical protein